MANFRSWKTNIRVTRCEASGAAADIFEWNSEETKRIFGETNKVDFQTQEFTFIINRLVW